MAVPAVVTAEPAEALPHKLVCVATLCYKELGCKQSRLEPSLHCYPDKNPPNARHVGEQHTSLWVRADS
jgi:hypothetical protein